MNAIEFVKDKGICEAKAVLLKSEYHYEVDVYLPDTKEFTYIAVSPTDSCPYVGLNDLKQIVDAFELVEQYGGIDGAKQHLNHRKEYGLYQLPNLIHAINLVEQCQ